MVFGAEKERIFDKSYVEYVRALSLEELVDRIYIMECLFDFEYFDYFEFSDSVVIRYELLRDECVRRLDLLACGVHERISRKADVSVEET